MTNKQSLLVYSFVFNTSLLCGSSSPQSSYRSQYKVTFTKEGNDLSSFRSVAFDRWRDYRKIPVTYISSRQHLRDCAVTFLVTSYHAPSRTTCPAAREHRLIKDLISPPTHDMHIFYFGRKEQIAAGGTRSARLSTRPPLAFSQPPVCFTAPSNRTLRKHSPAAGRSTSRAAVPLKDTRVEHSPPPLTSTTSSLIE